MLAVKNNFASNDNHFLVRASEIFLFKEFSDPL